MRAKLEAMFGPLPDDLDDDDLDDMVSIQESQRRINAELKAYLASQR